MIVMMSLADRAAEKTTEKDGVVTLKGSGYFTIRSLAARCRLSTRAVEGSIASLRRSGEIVITDSGRGPGAISRYIIPAIADQEPAKSAVSPDPLPDEKPAEFSREPAKSAEPYINKPEVNRRRKNGFVPPTVQECRAYARERGLPEKDGEHFHDRQSASGWQYTRHDWRAGFRAESDAGRLLTKPGTKPSIPRVLRGY